MIATVRSSVAALLAAVLVSPAGLRAQAADPIQIQVIEGQAATHSIEAGDATEPVVEVRDAQGQPVAGVEVLFRAPSVGPSVTFYGATRESRVRTDEQGRARATTMFANTEPGQFTIDVEAGAATTQINQSNAYTESQPERKKFRLGKKFKVLIAVGVGIAIAAIATGGND